MSKCSTNSMKVFTPWRRKPWDQKKVQHLYRRIGFGATPEEISLALTKTPSQVIDEILAEAKAKPITPAPWYNDWSNKEIRDGDGAAKQGIGDPAMRELWGSSRQFMMYELFDGMRSGSLRDRMVMFWMDHFASNQPNLRTPSMEYKKLALYQKFAVGNVKDFVRALGLDPWMHKFLNGIDNTKSHPNENYARELYELFTLGVDRGYTEQDIRETARALTGYNKWDRAQRNWAYGKEGTDPVFTPETFDDGQKTIFGKTGNWGYDDVIDILFQKRRWHVARHICVKLYTYFVSPETKWRPIRKMINTMLRNNFEILPVLSVMFKSKHFFDDETMGTIIKSPLDLEIQFQRELKLETGADSNNNTLNKYSAYSAAVLAMNPINPPNVFGWPKDKTWLNSDSLLIRWERSSHSLLHQRRMPYSYDQYDHFKKFAQDLFGVNEKDVSMIATKLVDYFLPNGLYYEDEYDEAIAVLKSNIPENHFEDGTWSLASSTAGRQVHELLIHISKSPEFQLR